MVMIGWVGFVSNKSNCWRLLRQAVLSHIFVFFGGYGCCYDRRYDDATAANKRLITT